MQFNTRTKDGAMIIEKGNNSCGPRVSTSSDI